MRGKKKFILKHNVIYVPADLRKQYQFQDTDEIKWQLHEVSSCCLLITYPVLTGSAGRRRGTCGAGEVGLCHHRRGLSPEEREVSAHQHFVKLLQEQQPCEAGAVIIMTIRTWGTRRREIEQFAQVHKAVWDLRTQTLKSGYWIWILVSPVNSEPILSRFKCPRFLNCKADKELNS